MKTIRFVLIVVLCNLFLSSLALASLKEIRLFPGLANEKHWNTFIAESTKAGKVSSNGILTDYMAEGAMDYMMNGKDEWSASLRKAINPDMLQEIKAGKYENYFRLFREFNGFGERIPLVTLKRLVSIRNGGEGIFAPMHQPLADNETVEITKKADVTTEVLATDKVVKPRQKPELDPADKFADYIATLEQKVKQLSANQGSNKEVQALKTQIASLKGQLTLLANNQQNSTTTVEELQNGIKALNTQLNEFSGDVSDLSSLVTNFSAGFKAKFAELEGKIPSNNLWLIIVAAVIAVIALLMSVAVARKNSSDGVAQAKINKKIRDDLTGVTNSTLRLDRELLEVSISNTSPVANARDFFIMDENSLTSKTLAELAIDGRKNVTIQVGDSALEVTFERKSKTDVLVHGIKRHESATEATISVSVTTNPAKVIRNAIARRCLIGTTSVNLSRAA